MKPDLQRAAQAIEEFLAALGHSAETNPELAGTGARVAQAFAEDLLDGYDSDPASILGDTCASTSKTDVVLVKGIAITVTCPHHLLPSTGTATVAYRPAGKLAGLGALGRLVQALGRRLALQETVAEQVAEALVEHLGATSAGCSLDLQPTCMIARGDRQVGARAVAMAFAGAQDDALRRALQ